MPLGDYPQHATIACSDLERAKAWYSEKLGLTLKSEDPGAAYYESGGSTFALFPTPQAGTAKNTVMEWSVKDLKATIDELKGRGVTFDHYDMPGVEWDGDIAIMGSMKGCWMTDSEGNILGITEATER